MRLIIKERKKLQESEQKNNFEVLMKPETFLALTLPKEDFLYVKKFFIKAIGQGVNKDYDALEALANQNAQEVDKNYPKARIKVYEIGRNVIERAIALIRKEGSYNASKAVLGIKILYGSYNTFVVAHSGRATSLFAILSGIDKVPVTTSGISKDQLELMKSEKRFIISQDFGFEKSKVNSDELIIL
jgi:hypothetical protein